MLSCFKRYGTKSFFIDICERIKNEYKSVSAFIDERQSSKYQRDNISNINQHRQNRRFRRSKRRNHNREKKTIHKANEKLVIEQPKAFCSHQNAINLGTHELTDTEKSFLRKGSSFVPNPTYINGFNLKCEFDNFVNKLRYTTTKENDENKKM